jgi:hypothetical protein
MPESAKAAHMCVLSLAVQAGRLDEKQDRQRWRNMRRISCLILLCVSLNAHCSDWVTIVSDMDSTFYFDRSSLKRDGDVVEVLLLWDFPTMQLTRRPVKAYMSATRLTRFDCKAGGRANVETTLYLGNMASGEVTEVHRTPDAELRYEWVNPEAPGGISMRKACEMR